MAAIYSQDSECWLWNCEQPRGPWPASGPLCQFIIVWLTQSQSAVLVLSLSSGLPMSTGVWNDRPGCCSIQTFLLSSTDTNFHLTTCKFSWSTLNWWDGGSKGERNTFLLSDNSMWVSVSGVVVGEDSKEMKSSTTPALVTGVKLVRQPPSPPQPIPAKTPHQLYPRVPGRTHSIFILQ